MHAQSSNAASSRNHYEATCVEWRESRVHTVRLAMDGMTPETLARFDGENGGEIYISFDGKVGGAGLGVDLETYQTDHVKNPGGSLSSGKWTWRSRSMPMIFFLGDWGDSLAGNV